MLGPLEVRTDGDHGQIVEVAGARLRALLVMLALHPGQPVTASQLIDGLWPADVPDTGFAFDQACSPVSCRTWCARVTTSCPQTAACPPSGRSSVARIRTAVVFPAPFGPRRPNTEPVGTQRSIPSNATVAPLATEPLDQPFGRD
jgi:hypothetical protein